jgi:hypothetical protein
VILLFSHDKVGIAITCSSSSSSSSSRHIT